ncbi:hypothetical protein H4R21_003686, partial [Coemansia helicoidea]
GGVLVRDGKATNCGVGLLDNMAALISATCLDIKDGAVDTSHEYEVLLDKGYTNNTERYTVSDFTIHPNFDASTLANNVALIQFNKGSDVAWYNYVWRPVGDESGTQYVYVQRALTSVAMGTWGTPAVSAEPTATDSTCKDFSPLYAANRQDLVCNRAVYGPLVSGLTKCKVPAQTLYAYHEGILFQAGFFSHAAVQGGSDLCNYKVQRSYYTMMSNYLMFARNNLDRTLYYYDPANTTSPQTDPAYKMNNVDSVDSKIASVLTGDMYGTVNSGDSSDDSSTTSTASRTTTSTTSSDGNSSSGGGSNSSNSSDGLSKKMVVIIAVCASLGSMLLAVAIVLLVRCLRRRRLRDPYLETNAQKFLAMDIGGATMPVAAAVATTATAAAAAPAPASAIVADDDDDNKPPPYAHQPRPFNPPMETPPAGFHVYPPQEEKYPPEKV